MSLSHPPVVHCDPETMGGVPVFVGSRLPASTLLACVDAGNSWSRIVASWPWLTPEHVEAARQWTQNASRDEGA